MNQFSRTGLAQVILALAIAAGMSGMAIALYSQHALGQAPCALCILQRYALCVAILAGFAVAVARKRSASPRRGHQIANGLMLVAALLGALVAARHAWSLHHPAFTCGADRVQDQVNALWTAQWLPQVFRATGSCADIVSPWWGLALPTWALLLFVLFMVAALLQWLSKRSASGPAVPSDR